MTKKRVVPRFASLEEVKREFFPEPDPLIPDIATPPDDPRDEALDTATRVRFILKMREDIRESVGNQGGQ